MTDLNTYDAYYDRRRTTVQADTSLNARNKAADFFKVSKKQRHMVTVVLVQKSDGTEVRVDPASL